MSIHRSISSLVAGTECPTYSILPHTLSLYIYIVYSGSVDPLFCLLGLLNGLLLLLLALGVEVVQGEGGHHVRLLEEELLDLAAHDGRHPAILLTIL